MLHAACLIRVLSIASAYGCYPRGSTGTHQCCWMERWGSCASLRPGGTQQGSALIILIIPHGRSRGAPAKTIVNSSCSDIGGAPGGHPARPGCCFNHSVGGAPGAPRRKTDVKLPFPSPTRPSCCFLQAFPCLCVCVRVRACACACMCLSVGNPDAKTL